MIADVIQKDVAEVRPESRLQVDLGFDSLMLTELSAALEASGVPVTAVSDLTKINTVDDLRRVVAQSGRKPAAEVKAREISREVARKKDSELELNLPDGVAEVGRKALDAGQRAIYGGLFDVKVTGKSFIPQNRNFLVVANHASHLDMGLVKVALGEQGERLVALAARDYFFDSPLKRAYFENFTNLIPMDRSGSLRESLRLAGESLTQGFNLLIFPEGTRSPNGELHGVQAHHRLPRPGLRGGHPAGVPARHPRRAAQGRVVAEVRRPRGAHRAGAGDRRPAREGEGAGQERGLPDGHPHGRRVGARAQGRPQRARGRPEPSPPFPPASGAARRSPRQEVSRESKRSVSLSPTLSPSGEREPDEGDVVNILVTGGTGFLGTHLVPLLRAQGHALTLISRSTAARRVEPGRYTPCATCRPT